MNQDEAKRLAAKAAIAEVSALLSGAVSSKPGGAVGGAVGGSGAGPVIGLGSGSTAKLFIDEVGALVAAGARLTGVPTSEASRVQAKALGIPLFEDDGPWTIDLTVDGADEVSASLDLIKGGGAAHTREKIVNYASARNVIVVDESKISTKLGEKWPIPLEVLSFGFHTTMTALAKLGTPKIRMKNGAPWISDAGNRIVDLAVGVIEDPSALDCILRAIPGIVETGLFVQRAELVIVAGENGIRELRR